MELINIKDRPIIGTAKVMIPEDWAFDLYSQNYFDNEHEVYIYAGDDGRLAVPVLRVGVQHDYDEVAYMAYAFVVPAENVYEIRLGTPIWRISGWDNVNRRTVNGTYYNEKDARKALSKLDEPSGPWQGIEFEDGTIESVW